jgi:hypothetical protein
VWACESRFKRNGGASPDFLLTLMSLTNFMRLSLMKAAHAGVGDASWQEIRVAPSFSAHVRWGERGAPVQRREVLLVAISLEVISEEVC